MPKPITAIELPGVWHSIIGQGILVYRLKIGGDLSAVMVSTYAEENQKGMDIYPKGKALIDNGYIDIKFSESPTTYRKLHLVGHGLACNGGECLLILQEKNSSEKLYFYKSSLEELTKRLLHANQVFDLHSE